MKQYNWLNFYKLNAFATLAIICLSPQPSKAIPSGIPNQQCSTISNPRPGDLCYVVHENQGGKANANDSPKGGEIIIQPQAGYYVVVEARSEVTSQAGNGALSKRVLSIGGGTESVNGYKSQLEELDKLVYDYEKKINANLDLISLDAKSKLNYLKEKREQYEEYYVTAVSAGKDAPKIQFSWSASSRKCGWGGLDTCGSWLNFRVYEVRRYLGNPIAEYNRLVAPAINQLNSALQNSNRTQQSSRNLFLYTNGKFIEQGNGNWIEERTNGCNSYFVETLRTDSYIELYDENRDIKVRLLENQALWSYVGENNWYSWSGSDGHWENTTDGKN
ncbi:hypothetical protein [Myxosarcina sp. GI1]|uniref:hypothetical protein n=1 Tax=Myxosarcina sp. GI1 TaxID=1541065 RepID=UPI00055DF60C|nr:hypothetical protein [Myxosarcina sp. GI1]